jgi:two-component system, LytTR family, response regulator
MAITAIIIDDEYGARESLANIIEQYCPQVDVFAKAENIDEGQALINEHHPDLIFLDIEMPHGNAFELLERFDEINFEIIFITAYDNYAINAIKFSALDYLLKPVDIEELQKAIEKHGQRNDKHLKEKYNLLLQNIKSGSAPEKIAVADSETITLIEISDIIRCESDGNYTTIFIEGDKKIVASKTLGEYEEMLSQNSFIRVHRSHLINLNKISSYVKGEGGYVIMSDGSKAEVSRRKKAEFLNKISQ